MTINPVFHARFKHIEIDYHFVREKVTLEALITRFLPSTKQIVDVFTKPLPKQSFLQFRYKLGVHCILPSSLREDDKERTHVTPQIHPRKIQEKFRMKSYNINLITNPK